MSEGEIKKFDESASAPAREWPEGDQPKVLENELANKRLERDSARQEEQENFDAMFNMVAKTFSEAGPGDEDKLRWKRADRGFSSRGKSASRSKNSGSGEMIKFPSAPKTPGEE